MRRMSGQDATGILLEESPNPGHLFIYSDAVIGIPANGTPGYAFGCILVNAVNAGIYQNFGTNLSCNFVFIDLLTQPVYNTNTATANTTLTGANVVGVGAGDVYLNLTGALGGAANAQLPTVAAMVAAMTAPIAGQAWRLRIINSSSGAFAWTVTTNTGWSALNGTMTIAQNTWRDFIVTLTSLTAASLQAVGTGTQS